jgi:hypothetical protein
LRVMVLAKAGEGASQRLRRRPGRRREKSPRDFRRVEVFMILSFILFCYGIPILSIYLRKIG